MCNSLLLPLVKRFKKHEMEVFDTIYGEFEKLINFYSFHNGSEDLRSELNLFFIELLYAIDLSRFKPDCSKGLKRYIAVCIRNRYIAISKKQQSDFNSRCVLYDNYAVSCEVFEDKIAIDQIFRFLTEKQKRVLVYKYILGYSDCEIAKKFNVERQAVNQIKRRALKILKTKIQEEICLN